MPGGEVGYVQLLGAARIRVGLKWTTFAPDKRHQLLAYLAYSSDWVSREKLAYLFWPDTSTQKAQQNLRQLLHRVRSLPWLSGPQVEAQRLRWPIETDVKLFKRALENNNLDEALSLYGGPLLENLESAEATEFNSWLEIEREGLHSQWRDALLRRVRELKERERHHEAIRLLGALLDHDPFDEEALLAYLDAATRAGQREQALKAYRDYAHRLRDELDLEPTLVVQSLAQAIQDRETNLLDSLPSPPAPTSTANLKVFPTPATSFVGRELELSEIVHLLSKPECRLLTLTGPGGIGKTRTALRAMQELAEDYSGGSYFVPLDSLTAPELIPSAIAEALGLKLHGQDEPLVQVIRYIGKKQILLVLDNYEQLLEGAILASRLIQDCPRLKLLITSRERLNLAEEWLLPVEGLPYPPLTPLPAASPLLGGTEGGWEDFHAVALFVQRAGQVRPSFRLTDEELSHVIKICQMVQGSPLAIELAAVWVRMMSCAEIAQELEANLDILSASTRNVSERHKSLRATFEHSWRLLTPVEQEVLRKVSVFRGGFRREAAAVVAGASMAVLASLVDKSLLRITSSGRYDRHPLVHQYSQEKLREHPEEEAQTKGKHAGYFLALAEEAEPWLMGAQQARWLAKLETEHDNLRSALAWSGEIGASQRALRLAGALKQFWLRHSHLGEGREQLGKALAQASGRTASQAKALDGAGTLAFYQGDYAAARSLHQESLAMRREVGDEQGVADSLDNLGCVAFQQGDYALACSLHEESLAIKRNLGDSRGISISLNNLGVVAEEQGDYPSARSLYEQSLAIARELQHEHLIAMLLANLGGVALAQGDYASARLLLVEGMTINRALGDKRRVAYALEGLAKLAAAQENPERATRLWGAAEAIREIIGAPLPRRQRSDYERDVAAARAKLDEEDFAVAWAQGRAMSMEEAVAYALGETQP